MSGERQHYLPQFLQRPFASKREGDVCFVWCYRKTGEGTVDCQELSTTNVGVESKFYGVPDGPLDTTITLLEGEFQSLHTWLLESPLGKVDQGNIPSFLTHLETRSMGIRMHFDAFMARMREWVEDLISESSIVFKLRTDLRARGEPVNDEALRAMVHGQMPGIKRKFSNWEAGMPHEIKKWHNKSMQDFSGTGKIAEYAQFDYRIVGCENTPFVLSDSALFFRMGTHVTAINPNHQRLEEVWLPLSPERCLVGTRNTAPSPIASIQRNAAATAQQFFIADRDNHKELGPLIATEGKLLVEAFYQLAVSDIGARLKKS